MALPASLTARNLTLDCEGTTIVQDLTLAIPFGQIVALVDTNRYRSTQEIAQSLGLFLQNSEENTQAMLNLNCWIFVDSIAGTSLHQARRC